MTGDGRASPFDVSVRLAERTGAQCYPMPTPVVAGSVEERSLLQTQRSVTTVHSLSTQAKAFVIGVGHVGWNAPVHADGFVDDNEISELIDAGAIAELIGWPFNGEGQLVPCSVTDRLAGIRPMAPPTCPTIAVAGGPSKVAAIGAVLRGGLLSGLITDQDTAETLLATATTHSPP